MSLGNARGLRKFSAKLYPIIGATVIASLMIGCAGAPKPKPTVIQVGLEAAANVNPDARGRPSPIILRFYELKSPTSFNNADFFSLYEHDQETLGADRVAKEEIQLTPGEKRQFERQTQPDTHYIGVIAAFRDLEHAQWRSTLAVPLQQTTPITIKLDGSTIVISAH